MEQVQQRYVEFLSDWRTDLGGKKNFHNGAGGTYDCIALMAYYIVCRAVTSLAEIEKMEGELFLPAFRILSKFVDCNRPLCRKLLHRSFASAQRKCGQWNDYRMTVAPYPKTKEGWDELGKRGATAHANYVIEKIDRLNCPTWQKLELLQAVIDTTKGTYQPKEHQKPGCVIHLSDSVAHRRADSMSGKKSPKCLVGLYELLRLQQLAGSAERELQDVK